MSILVLVFSVGLCGCANQHNAEMEGIPVRTEKIQNQMVSQKTQLVGWMDSRKSVKLFPRVDGYVNKIYVTAGQKVMQGQLMIEIDPTRQQATVASTRSEVALAAADLEKEKGQLKSLVAQKYADKAKLDYETIQYARYYYLNQKNVVAQAMVDTADTSRKVAQANVESLNEQIGAQKDVIASAQRRLEATNSKLKEQEAILYYYYIRAPFEGIVGDLPAKEGAYVEQKSNLTTVSQTKPLEINVDVPKVYSQELRNGLDLELVGTDGKVAAHCPIFYVSPIIDPNSQSVLVKATYQNNQGTFRPAQSIEVRIIFSRQLGLTVPTEALYFMVGKPFVFLVSTGKKGEVIAKQCPVSVTSVEENRALIASGLKPGDTVVVSGVQNLFDGAPIKPTQSPSE
jgi:multidrug efflux pump subunit AcrA (membrane-fusion protein)